MLPMRLPEVIISEQYPNMEPIRRIAEWVFSPSSRSIMTNSKATISRNQKHRPTSLNLDYPEHAAANPDDDVKSSTNVFCLSGPAQSGKTQLTARTCEWFAHLGCLGGYFSFDVSQEKSRATVAETSRQLLDALPMTLIHQACTVEPDLTPSVRNAFVLKESAVHDTLEKRFEVLFVEPVKAFVTGRSGAAFNPLDPLVFVIDGLGTTPNENSTNDHEEYQRMAQMFVDWISSKVVRCLPAHIKFLVVTRPDTGIHITLRERGAQTFDMAPTVFGSPDTKSAEIWRGRETPGSATPNTSTSEFSDNQI